MKHILLTVLLICVATGCSARQKLEWSADTWHGHTLREVEAAWGAPSYPTTPDRWTTWRVGNDQGGWIINFRTGSDGRIHTSTVHTWGKMPSQLPDELAPSA